MSIRESDTGSPFRFKKGASIGEPDAESDDRFLSDCFTDTGDYEAVRDCSSPQRIIVGRTGTGKSALIQHLKRTEEHVIDLPPENLALNYISNSDILSVLERAGVKLDLFYTLLWKHVFAVELIRHRYQLSNEERTRSWLSRVLASFEPTDKAKERALEYLRDWGDKFWHETEYRIKEVTLKLESDIKQSLGTDLQVLQSKTEGELKSSSEKKIEVVHKAQAVVNSIQVKALADVIRVLAEDVFNDPKQKFYVVIDKLDENWVDDSLRHRLIRALIETVKTFRTVSNVKIVVALRFDLLRTVFEKTRDAGFQEEKYQALFLHLRWNKEMLERLLDKRIAKLVREQYTSKPVRLRELFPEKVGHETFPDYLLNKTLYRPRDAIAFVNECLKNSDGRSQVRSKTVTQAELEYSASRVDSLCFEWAVQYPGLPHYLALLQRLPARFRLSTITKEVVDKFCLEHCVRDDGPGNDPVLRTGQDYLNGKASLHAFVVVLTKALFLVGALGLKPDSFSSQLWSFKDSRPPSDGSIKPGSEAFVHPMLWSWLGTVVR